MYPILYAADETAFTTNGIGMLSECTKCTVKEERNGIYECEFSVPITARHFADIDIDKIVTVPHDDTKDRQPFVIYRRSAPIDGIVTFYAHHISYKLSNVIIPPMQHSGIVDTFEAFENDAITANPFSFETTKSSSGTFKTIVPVSIRAMLGGTQGSILDVFGGGEYEFDNFTVKLHQHRGSDNGVTIRYGKNLTDIEQEKDGGDTYNAVVPYWEKDGVAVYGSIVQGTNSGTAQVVVPLDLSEEFETQPTAAQLEAKALTFLDANTPWVPKENIEVDFVALWQTSEYENIAVLERVKLCDTVSVYYPAAGITAKAKVIKVEYDALAEKYSKIELGDARTSFAASLTARFEAATEKAVAKTAAEMEDALDHATQLITGGLGGHLVIGTDANGKPQELLLMDAESAGTAEYVLRINVNGIGFSSNGVEGPFSTAWTLDGAFSANWITAGYLSCNRIKGGILTLGGSQNGDGYIVINDEDDDLIARIDKDGIIAHSLTADDFVYVYGSGGSRIYTPANVSGVSVQDPADPAYVDLSNRGLTIQAEREFTGMAEEATLKTIYPADSDVTYRVYSTALDDWVTMTVNGVVSATTEDGKYEDELVDHRAYVDYIITPQGGPYPYPMWMDFDSTTAQATSTKSYSNTYLQFSDRLEIETTERTRYTGEYTWPYDGSPIEGFYFKMDESEYIRQTLRLRPWMISMSKTEVTPSLTQGGQMDHVTDNFYVNVADHEVSIGGDHTWSFVVNDVNLAKIAEAYPSQPGHNGACAVWHESGMCKYLSFAANPNNKTLYVYGSNDPDSIAYIGRVQLI